MAETKQKARARMIKALGGRLTANDDRFIDQVTDAALELVREEREDCAKAMCWYCDHETEWGAATRENNFTHSDLVRKDGTEVFCSVGKIRRRGE